MHDQDYNIASSNTSEGIKWLFLDLNSYFASVEQQYNPQLRGKPVAVVPLETDATCAIAASYEAKEFGVKTGTPIYKAKKLCPDLICVLANHERYVEFHEMILAEIDRHIPVTDIASIDEVACELDKYEQQVPAAIALAKRIKAGIYKNVGEAISCSIGLAPNRFLAKIATELEKPDGLVVIEPKDIPHKLLNLTFNDIPGIGKNMQLRLERNGIFTMQQLYQLPPKHMRAIWHSVAGERMYYGLRGIEIEKAETIKRHIGHSHVLAPENRLPPQTTAVSKRLLLKAASRLRRLGYFASVMSVSVTMENGLKLHKERKFKTACDNNSLTDEWLNCWEALLAQMDLNQTRIKKVGVTLSGLIMANQVQEDLFDFADKAPTTARNKKLSNAMDALNNRFGRNTITTADTLGSANVVTGTKIAFSRIPDMQEFKE